MDVHTKEQLLQQLETSQRRVAALLESVADVQDWQPEPAEWSFRCIAAHLATVEQKCHLRRVKLIASGENPYLAHYWNIGGYFYQHDLRDSLRRWIFTRQKLINFVRALSEQELLHTGTHEAIGSITVLDTLQEILEQDQGHYRHLTQLIIEYLEEAMMIQWN
jgi:hypothetical protein